MKMKKRGVIVGLIIVFLVFLSLFVSAYTFNYTNTEKSMSARIISEEKLKEKDYEGYIVEFKKSPAIEKKLDLDKEKEGLIKIGSFSEAEKKEGEKEKIISDYRKELELEHSAALNDLDKILKKEELPTLNPVKIIINFFKKLFITGKAIDETTIKPEREFYYAFNGIVLNISDEEAERIKQSEYVKNVYPNRVVQTLLDTSIPAMETDLARNYAGLTGENVVIAVIDTGIDAKHESLDDLDDNPLTNDPKVIGWKDYVNFNPQPYDDMGHGTHCAGIAAGTGGGGIYKGVAPRAKLVGVKVLDDWGSGTFSDVIAGIEWTIQNKDEYNISIISMSLGGDVNSDGTTPVEIAADYAVASGINFVVAAGNSGPSANTVGIPASAFNVITVGAINDNLKIASFSSRGPTKDGRIKPEISAVGVDVISSVPKGDCYLCDSSGYMSLDGTSMATPHVAGFVALLLQYNSSLSTSDVKNLLTSTALDKGETGADNTYGYGVLNGLKTMFSIIPPQHEIALSTVNFPNFLETGKQEQVTAEIENFGLNNENVKIEFLVNNILQENRTVNVLSRSKKQVNFSYTAVSEGNYTFTVKVLPVINETTIANNEKSKELRALAVDGRIKAAVVDSWGSDRVESTIFNDLNENWMNYGNYAVEIDYKTLNKEAITYQDINATNADVLIISDAWANGNLGMYHQYTNEEIAAVNQYVKEGHGLIGTSGTLSELVENNMKLAELFGLKNKTGLWNDWDAGGGDAFWGKKMSVLAEDAILTKNIPNSYSPGDYGSVLNLEFDENKDTVKVGEVIERKDIFVSAYKPSLGASIYFTYMPELMYSNEIDRQFFYNAVLWTSKNTGALTKDIALYSLSAPERVILNSNDSISAKVKNNGAVPENVIVELIVDGKVIENKTISLLGREEKTISFNLTFSELKTYSITVAAVPLKNETYLINNKVKTQIFVPFLVLNGNNKDYGLDTNGNGLYDYIVVELGADVFGSGYYSASLDLESFLGAEIEKSVYTYGDISATDKNITLKIPALKINKMELDGPYKIKNFKLSFEGEKIYDVEELLTTQAYKTEEFEIPSKFTRKFSDYGLDIDKDGLYDWLVINAEVDIKSAGNYSIRGSLYYSWNYIGYGGNETYLDKGIQNITLLFNGMDIRKEGYDGTYLLKYLYLYLIENKEWNVQDSIEEAYETKYYRSDEFDSAADLSGYIQYSSFILNEKNNINVTLYNDGSETTQNGTAALYYQKDYCNAYGGGGGGGGGGPIPIEPIPKPEQEIGECNNLVLIETKNVEVDVGKKYNTHFEFTPTEEGYFTFVLVSNASNDINPDNNIETAYLEVKQRGADLSVGWVNYGNFIVNQTSNLNVTLYNDGSETTQNGTAALYYQKDYCCYSCGECNNLSLIETKNVEISAGKYEKEVFVWEPTEEGYFTFVLILNATNEVDSDDNDYITYINVKLPGPDPSIYFSWENWYREFIVDVPNNITLELSNYGTEDATNIIVSLYEENYIGDPEWKYVSKLIGTANINKLPIYEYKYVNISWTPTESKWYYLMVNISSDKDVDEDNNKDYFSVKVVKNETDVKISNIYAQATSLLDKENEISVWIENLGKSIENAVLNVYDNGVLTKSKTIANLAAGRSSWQYVYWTPKEKGKHTIKADISAANDINSSNNYLEKEVYAYSGINVIFTIKDSMGDNAKRILASEYFEYDDEIIVDGAKTILLPNLSETNEKFSFWIANMSKEMTIGTMFNISLSNQIDIISEFYNKTTEGYIDYYAVFANKITQESSNNEFLLELSKQYLSDLGIENMKDYDLFYCKKFNFASKSCNATWKKAGVYNFYEWFDEIQIEAYTKEPAEAFALSRSLQFDGSTTNLTEILENEIFNFTLEKRLYGKIIFKDKVNITRFKNSPQLLNENAAIEFRKIKVDTENLTELKDKKAELLFRNIDLHNPKMLYNGADCPSSICTSVIYSTTEKTLKADIVKFSQFEIVEGPYCGDGTCQAEAGEKCDSCVADCGSCTPPSDNGEDGGGDGGGEIKICVTKWNCTWSLCQNNIQKYTCVDLNKCGITTGKPKEETKACIINADCTDNDKDGYGVGKDCLGPDINDNDPGVTNIQPSIEPEKPETAMKKLKDTYDKYKAWIILSLILLILIIAIIIVVVLLLKHNKQGIKKEIFLGNKK